MGLADWPRVLGAVDKPPGRAWIDFIRQAMEDSQSIVAVPVTGSLVSPTLFSCWDAICTTRYSIYWIVCGTDWVLPAGYQVLLPEYVEGWAMDADGFSIVDNRAGVTFFVGLCCASAKHSRCFRNGWSSRQRDRESRSSREGRP